MKNITEQDLLKNWNAFISNVLKSVTDEDNERHYSSIADIQNAFLPLKIQINQKEGLLNFDLTFVENSDYDSKVTFFAIFMAVLSKFGNLHTSYNGADEIDELLKDALPKGVVVQNGAIEIPQNTLYKEMVGICSQIISVFKNHGTDINFSGDPLISLAQYDDNSSVGYTTGESDSDESSVVSIIDSEGLAQTGRDWYLENAEHLSRYLNNEDKATLDILLQESELSPSMHEAQWDMIKKSLSLVKLSVELFRSTLQGDEASFNAAISGAIDNFRKRTANLRREYQASISKVSFPMSKEAITEVLEARDKLNLQNFRDNILQTQSDKQKFDAIIQEHSQNGKLNTEGWDAIVAEFLETNGLNVKLRDTSPQLFDQDLESLASYNKEASSSSSSDYTTSESDSEDSSIASIDNSQTSEMFEHARQDLHSEQEVVPVEENKSEKEVQPSSSLRKTNNVSVDESRKNINKALKTYIDRVNSEKYIKGHDFFLFKDIQLGNRKKILALAEKLVGELNSEKSIWEIFSKDNIDKLKKSTGAKLRSPELFNIIKSAQKDFPIEPQIKTKTTRNK